MVQIICLFSCLPLTYTLDMFHFSLIYSLYDWSVDNKNILAIIITLGIFFVIAGLWQKYLYFACVSQMYEKINWRANPLLPV